MEIRIIIDGESVSVNADQSRATAHRPEEIFQAGNRRLSCEIGR